MDSGIFRCRTIACPASCNAALANRASGRGGRRDDWPRTACRPRCLLLRPSRHFLAERDGDVPRVRGAPPEAVLVEAGLSAASAASGDVGSGGFLLCRPVVSASLPERVCRVVGSRIPNPATRVRLLPSVPSEFPRSASAGPVRRHRSAARAVPCQCAAARAASAAAMADTDAALAMVPMRRWVSRRAARFSSARRLALLGRR